MEGRVAAYLGLRSAQAVSDTAGGWGEVREPPISSIGQQSDEFLTCEVCASSREASPGG